MDLAVSLAILQGKGGAWIKRFLLFALAFLLLFGLFRFYRFLVPAPPEIYKIGMDASWYPLGLYGKESSFTAFSSDILFAIARNQKIKVEILRSGPKRLQELLEDGKVDAILTSLTPDPKLEEEYYFSDPYYRFGAIFVVRKDIAFTSLKDLKGKRIGVKRNSPLLYRVSIDSEALIVPYDSLLFALEDLGEGGMDGLLVDQLLAYLYFAGFYRDHLKIVTLPLTPEGLRLVTLQETYAHDLIEKFNLGLENLKKEGLYEKYLNQWDLYNPGKLVDLGQ